ncbi:hypothetical protein DSM107003_27450 [Trichormus variabilis SAG 1403-4b]|uniref:Uncharacterized protein n=1 Tax=Trichormus variabilis SAG 1403-4b TaxID=447716 RepID=A0A3S1CPJ1_ANAVA|nr:hypothetical protein DSM107003_27450 [Trichormus variabilis SAG 1403-4b]
MLAGLLFTSLVLIFLVFDNPERDWRSSVLSAGVVWGVLATFFTECKKKWSSQPITILMAQ